MKGLIRWSLNHIPRKYIQRVASWAMPIAGLLYRGRGVVCPICDSQYRKFMPYGYVTSRPNALCPRCLSLERHRLMWLYITNETNIEVEKPKILHIAPEVCIMKQLKARYKEHPNRYTTADLESPLADLHFDILDIPLPDGYADVVICNHILEHVDNDITALKELYRVVKSGGWGIILSPVELSRQTTFEDDSITDPDQRTDIFGQYDHRRVYGMDYATRLASVGFVVEDIDYRNQLTDQMATLYALTNEHLYIVRKN